MTLSRTIFSDRINKIQRIQGFLQNSTFTGRQIREQNPIVPLNRVILKILLILSRACHALLPSPEGCGMLAGGETTGFAIATSVPPLRVGGFFFNRRVVNFPRPCRGAWLFLGGVRWFAPPATVQQPSGLPGTCERQEPSFPCRDLRRFLPDGCHQSNLKVHDSL